MEIRAIELNQFIDKVIELCSKIALTYGLNEPDTKFAAHFAHTLKKYHGTLTIEQVELSFEANSMGLLNEYLPRNAMSVDNKVKFSIPDLMKIVRAYIRFKKLDGHDEKINQEPELTKKDASIQNWCNSLEQIFRTYATQFKRSPISIPTFTCEVLAVIGVLDAKRIDYTENTINIGLKQTKLSKCLHNVDLIYESFDNLLDNGKELKPYLDKFRYKYAENQIPIF